MLINPNSMLRNFITTIKRYTTASILNIIGLSVALGAFYVIMSQVMYELSFDKWHKDADRIYKVELSSGESGQTVVSRAFITTFAASSPLIENAVMVSPPWIKNYITVERNGDKVGFVEELEGVFPSIAEIFDFKMVEGSLKALDEPLKLIVPQSKAKIMFGEGSCLGKLVTTEWGASFEVGGVYEDFPDNTQINNRILYKVPENEGRNKDGTDMWGQNNYFMYVKLAKGADPVEIGENYAKKINLAEKMNGSSMQPYLTRLSDLYFAKRNFAIEHLIKHGDKNTTIVMFSIAILILVIAAINFINFATSIAPMRMKGVNIKKVLGSTDLRLRLSLVGEAVFLCMISYLFALIIISMLSESAFQNLTMNKIAIAGNENMVIITALVAIVLGAISGIYPAVYTTNFSPALALKGGVFSSTKGQFLRNMLIGIQFVISMVLIISAIFLQMQNYYMKRLDTGLPKDNIVIAELGGQLLSGSTFENRLKENPIIEDVAYSQFNVGGSNDSQGWGRTYKDKSIQFAAHLVSWNFPKMMKLTMVDGNMFVQEDVNKSGMTYLFNQAAAKQYGIEVGDDPSGVSVKGIVKDFNFRSLHNPITPMALVLSNQSRLSISYIKVNGDPYEAVSYIKKIAKEVDSAYPISLRFYDETFNNLYQKEQKSTLLITLFSILTIILSLVGVFGLVIFETQFRRKEIGLRKINGASITSILMMFNRKFMILVLICSAIAVPIAILGVNKWLEEFAYRTPIEVWVFVVALLVVTLITTITVTLQSWRAATENPVDSVKSGQL